MKLKTILLPILAGGSLILPSWGEPATHLIQAEATEATSLVDPAKAAKKLGYAAHAAKDTEAYFSLIGAYDMYQRLLKTDVGQLMLETTGMNAADLEQMEEDEDFQMVKAIFGEEIFVVFGDTSGEQGVHLNTLGKSSNFHQMKMLVKMAAMNMTGEADPDEMESAAMGMFSSLLGDPEAGVNLVEKADVPPITLGFKVSDEDMRTQLSEMIIGGMISMFDLGEDAPFDEVDQKIGGVQVNGMTIVGKKLAALADEDTRQEMTEAFGSRAAVDRLMTAVAGKNLHLLSGIKGDYIFIHIGGSLDGLKFAASPAESLVANSGMNFLKDYVGKDIRMLAFGEEEAMKLMYEGNEALTSMAKGLKEGLSEVDAFGDTRDIQALLGHVAKLDTQLFKMIQPTGVGSVGFIEDGFKIESHGGSNLPSLDTSKPHTYSALGELDDVIFFSNARSNPEFTGKLLDLVDSLGEAAYLMAGRVAEMDIDDHDFQEFAEGFGMFNELAATDLKNIWRAFSTDWAQGTGDEGALIIDTKGTMPKVPEVPGAIIEKGRIPRIAYVTPVADRAKLTSAWKRIEQSIANILKTVKEMDGPEIPMQEIDDNTKDGITYYSTAIQFSTKDARPVVGISEDQFFFSTSQKFITELNGAIGGADAPVRNGSYTRINFAAARDLADYWVNLMKEHGEEIFENEFQRDDFNENLPMIKKFIEAFGQFEDLTMYTRKEDGETRSSVHFRMK